MYPRDPEVSMSQDVVDARLFGKFASMNSTTGIIFILIWTGTNEMITYV